MGMLFKCSYCRHVIPDGQLVRARITKDTPCPSCNARKIYAFLRVEKITCMHCRASQFEHVEEGLRQDKWINDIYSWCCGRKPHLSYIFSYYKHNFNDGRGEVFQTVGHYLEEMLPIKKEQAPAKIKMKKGEYIMNDQEIKHGDNLISIKINRGFNGTIVHVKSHKVVEAFMASISNNKVQELAEYGGQWTSSDPESQLKVYNTDIGLDTSDYTINQVGSELFLGDQINLSFLRLKNISSEDGVSFRMMSPLKSSQFRDLENRLMQTTTSFIKDYIKPINIEVTISSS